MLTASLQYYFQEEPEEKFYSANELQNIHELNTRLLGREQANKIHYRYILYKYPSIIMNKQLESLDG